MANCDDFGNKIWRHFEFSNDAVHWKRILVSNNWRNAVDTIMGMGVTTETTRKSIDAISEPYIKNIVDDGLMDYVCKYMPGAWIRSTYHDYHAIWQSGYPSCQIVLNPILAQLKFDNIINYCKKNSIENCRYYKCVEKNVDFKYNNHYFQWWGNPNEKQLDIYLMDENWNSYIKRPNPTADNNIDEDTYYCFRVTKDMENDTSLFMKQLDSILERASSDAKEWVTNIYKTNQRDAKIEENSLYISGNNLTITLFVKNLTPRWGVKCEQTASKEYQDQIISKIKDLNFGNMHFNADGYLVWSETSYKNGESRFKKLIEVLSEYKIEQ